MAKHKRTVRRANPVPKTPLNDEDGGTVATELPAAPLLARPDAVSSLARTDQLEDALVEEVNEAMDLLKEAMESRSALDARIGELQLAIRDRRLKIRVLKSIS